MEWKSISYPQIGVHIKYEFVVGGGWVGVKVDFSVKLGCIWLIAENI